ncbi:MAG: hypothetical protein HRJ53_25070 [Acidobacteria bacterium Pan2503]|uniref:Uncharacterized protein n=1 Tax=Candidatus Acidiferrum panamense TaxID=2741543 RepID=A0A7V8NVG8_9BACT|nr:hypothetical protein [Candidatus Acidoferrum panamensis]
MTEFTEWLNLQMQMSEVLQVIDTMPEDKLRRLTKELIRQLRDIAKRHVLAEEP